MLEFLNDLRESNKDDEKVLKAINEIEAELNNKKYGLVWEEHEEEVDRMLKDNIPVFSEVYDKEIKEAEDDGFNFLLEGDNLHSLKLLEKTHKGKVDVIYIDPPYNTGNKDFVYDDTFVDKEDSFRHSKWLSFMKNRLEISKRVLSRNGFIIVSIDDNEYAPLKILLDEVFGENKFINSFIWKRNSSGKTEKDKYTVNTEYLLLYSNSTNYTLNSIYKPLSESTIKMYKKDDNDGRGPYRLYPLQKPAAPGPETTYDYVDNNGKVWPCPAKGWRMKYEKLKALENDGRLYLGNKSLSEKAYWNERENEGKRIDTLWDDLSENSVGSKELKDTVGEQEIFNNPKPVDLIQRCSRLSGKNSTILDFFAGSGTTAQAVLELNKEDDGNRKFILCTNNENNICEDITYQRIKTVITGKRKDGSEYSEGIPANLKYYKTDFVSKDEEYLTDDLNEHIKEMIQLELGVDIDDVNYCLVLSDDDTDELEEKIDEMKDLKGIYVSKDVLLTSSQKSKFKNLEKYVIPDCYYDKELKESGE